MLSEKDKKNEMCCHTSKRTNQTPPHPHPVGAVEVLLFVRSLSAVRKAVPKIQHPSNPRAGARDQALWPGFGARSGFLSR